MSDGEPKHRKRRTKREKRAPEELWQCHFICVQWKISWNGLKILLELEWIEKATLCLFLRSRRFGWMRRTSICQEFWRFVTFNDAESSIAWPIIFRIIFLRKKKNAIMVRRWSIIMIMIEDYSQEKKKSIRRNSSNNKRLNLSIGAASTAEKCQQVYGAHEALTHAQKPSPADRKPNSQRSYMSKQKHSVYTAKRNALA